MVCYYRIVMIYILKNDYVVTLQSSTLFLVFYSIAADIPVVTGSTSDIQTNVVLPSQELVVDTTQLSQSWTGNRTDL